MPKLIYCPEHKSLFDQLMCLTEYRFYIIHHKYCRYCQSIERGDNMSIPMGNGLSCLPENKFILFQVVCSKVTLITESRTSMRLVWSC